MEPDQFVPRPRSVVRTGGTSRLGALELAGHVTRPIESRLRSGWPVVDATASPTAVTFDVGSVSLRPPPLGVDESYSVVVTPAGVVVSSPTDIGARRAVETVLQLAHETPDGLPHVAIDDAPRSAWRGLLLDPCRHWIGVDAVLDTIDAMAAAKLNVLHLHLSDDQAFRLESRTWPELHRRGSDGDYYSHDDIATIIEHASDAGIRVVPELDMPGHVTSWLVAYPELAATPGPFELRTSLGIATVALDPLSPVVQNFIAQLLAEIVDLFPDRYLHIGGDEVSPEAWPDLDVAPTQRRFTSWATEMVRSLGRRPIVWDEAWYPGLSHEVTTQVWRGHRRLRAAAAAGQPVLFSTPYYLDLGYDPVHHWVDPAVDREGWELARSRLHDDPRLGRWAPVALSIDTLAEGDDEAPDVVDVDSVLGGEACMWSELVPQRQLPLRLWPSAAAVADALWSGVDVDDPWRHRESLNERMRWFESYLAATTSTDTDAIRSRRWLELAGGEEALADAVEVLANCCEPSKWYSRHVALHDGRLDVPFDRFVDSLPPVAATPTASDPARWRHAAERILAAEHRGEQLADLAPLARELLRVCEGEPTPLADSVGDVLVTARLIPIAPSP